MAFGALLYLRDHDQAVNARSMLLFYRPYGLRQLSIDATAGRSLGWSHRVDYEYYLRAYMILKKVPSHT